MVVGYIKLISLLYTRWCPKNLASFLTNEMQNQNQPHTARAIFPALWASYSLVIAKHSGARFSKVPKTFRARKAIRKTATR